MDMKTVGMQSDANRVVAACKVQRYGLAAGEYDHYVF